MPKYTDQNQIGSNQTPDTESVDHFGLAADCFDRGDLEGSTKHLSAYLQSNPDQVVFRIMLADQLFQIQKWQEAKSEYEKCLDDFFADSKKHRESLIQCQTKLMQIAQKTDNEANEKAHRAIGLVLVVESCDGDPKWREDQVVKKTLNQAIDMFKDAHELGYNEAISHYYLGVALARLGQTAAAKSEFAIVQNSPPGSIPNSLLNNIP